MATTIVDTKQTTVVWNGRMPLVFTTFSYKRPVMCSILLGLYTRKHFRQQCNKNGSD